MSITNGTVKAAEVDVKKVLEGTGTKSGKMVEMFKMGMEVKEIAELMGVRYNFVYNVVQNHTIKTGTDMVTTKKPTQKSRILELHRAGKTKIEIARELRVEYNQVWQVIKKGT